MSYWTSPSDDPWIVATYTYVRMLQASQHRFACSWISKLRAASAPAIHLQVIWNKDTLTDSNAANFSSVSLA